MFVRHRLSDYRGLFVCFILINIIIKFVFKIRKYSMFEFGIKRYIVRENNFILKQIKLSLLKINVTSRQVIRVGSSLIEHRSSQ